MRRRRYLAALGGAALVPGCLALGDDGGGHPTTTDPPDDRSPTDWERSTDCDAMHDSVIRLEWVTESETQSTATLSYDDFTEAERSVLARVFEDGGVGTCDASDAFRGVVDRVGRAVVEEDVRMVDVLRDGRYHGLYVEHLDQVFSY